MSHADWVREGRDTFPKLLAINAERFADRPASREKMYGIWQTWTWRQVHEETRAFALGLIELGLQPGERMAIVGSNRPPLYWSMVSAQMVGAIPVPVYQDSVADEMAYVLAHAEVTFVIAENQEQVDKVLSIKDRLPDLRHVVYRDPRGLRNYDHATLHSFTDVQKLGREAGAQHTGDMDQRIASGAKDDTCVMLYTSGTTGNPKGVVLTNQNVIFAAASSCEFDNLKETDETLAYLPMAWVGDFIFSIGQSYWSGFCVSCPESPDTMMHDLKEIGPTYFFAPPRIFENLLTSVMIRMEDAPAWMRRIFRRYIDFAKETGATILDGKPVGMGAKFNYWLGNLLVYGPLKNSLGLSRVRLGYTAGEAIGPEIFAFYRSLGINLKQLYGQTEASVFITIQPDGQVRDDTVGVASPGVELKIDDDGRVWYRSPGVFQEYYKEPEKTADTKDAEGWVDTGDAGFLEPDTGHLRIIDRAKDVGKMADGSLFAPKYVENKLKFYPNILEAVVLGDGRDTCTAFINIDLGAVGSWAERNNVSYASYQELAGNPQVYATLQEHIEEVNASVAADSMLSGCQIHRFLVLHKELDPDDGEMTRTRKVRRATIAERYKPLIDALYDGSTSVFADTEVTYEDGRKGSISATLEIRDVKTFPRATAQAQAA
ncbi:MAG: AMP-binding protein [Pseudomonadota bacterium]